MRDEELEAADLVSASPMAGYVAPGPAEEIGSISSADEEPEIASKETVAEYEAYKALVARTVDAFGDPIRASRWLSMPSRDFGGATPLQIAEEDGYALTRIDPILIRLEHGIYF